MPRKTLKEHKGSFLFTSMVASAALAPILTGQMEQDEEHLPTNQPLPHTANISKQMNLKSQGISYLPHNQIKWKYSSINNDNETLLVAGNHEERRSNVINMIAIKEKNNLPTISKETEDNILLFEKIETIWPEDTILSLGDRGEKVETIQEYLKEIGFYVNEVDGIFGEKTFEAVKLYQKEHGLAIDGIVGKETIGKIVGTKHLIENDFSDEDKDNQLSPLYTPEELTEMNIYMKHDLWIEKIEPQVKTFFQFGDEGEQIAHLQEKLKQARYYSGPIDGIFGSYTQQAVRALQRDNQLTVDGIAGKEVIHFLETNNLDDIALKREAIINKEKASRAKTTITMNQTAASPPATNTSSTNLATIENIINHATNLIGTPYRWGGVTPSGFDCSGFLVYLFGKEGKHLPRTVKDIWNATTSVSTPSRGDLVFFQTYTTGPSHTGIYLGDGAFIHSGTSTGVTISYLNENYWKTRYLGARSY